MNANQTEASTNIRYPTEEEVRYRAYQLHTQRGCQPGHEVEDWLQAQQDLLKSLNSNVAEVDPSKPQMSDDKK